MVCLRERGCGEGWVGREERTGERKISGREDWNRKVEDRNASLKEQLLNVLSLRPVGSNPQKLLSARWVSPAEAKPHLSAHLLFHTQTHAHTHTHIIHCCRLWPTQCGR